LLARLKKHVHVAVVGGGIVGSSVLYHLTKLGWRDVVLCERNELSAGSSWHAAGAFHALNRDPGLARLQAGNLGLYREVAQLTGQDMNLHITGLVNVATTPARWEALRAAAARSAVDGSETPLFSPEQIQHMCPLIDIRGVLGGVYDPRAGYLDPSSATQALAAAACRNGAEIYSQMWVVALAPTARSTWRVFTNKGDFEAEHVVNAGGLWAREVGAMAGIELPLVPIEHHCLLTNDLPEFSTRSAEMPIVVDLDGGSYIRQAGKGAILGLYESRATSWAEEGTPWDYAEAELLPPRLERISEALEKGFRRFPSLSKAGLRRTVNGPLTFTPDGNPLVGPVRGIRNYWVACGVMAGFCQASAVGLTLSEWMIQGEPATDVFAMDVARFGEYATRRYTVGKARESYSRRLQIAYPNQHKPAGRPAKTSPLHEHLRARGAVFGVSYGMEYPLWFGSREDVVEEEPLRGRSNAFPYVAAECHAARSSVCVLDISTLGRYEVIGPGAPKALDRIFASRLPAVGAIGWGAMLSERGRLMGHMTILRLAPERFLLTGSGYLQAWHLRWFETHLAGAGVQIRNVSETTSGIGIFGPNSRTLLAQLADVAVTNDAMPFMTVRECGVGLAPAVVGRLSRTGELGYEIHVPAPYLGALYRAATDAGEALGLKDAGMCAVNSLRLEKCYGIWSREYSPDFTPDESGLSHLVDDEKSNFIGRDAVVAARRGAPHRRLVALAVEARERDAVGSEPVCVGKRMVGFTTSGGYGHTSGVSLALAYVDSDQATSEAELSVTVADEVRPCRILPAPVADPTDARLRG
jgi:dimethylglycine dehydrogenase